MLAGLISFQVVQAQTTPANALKNITLHNPDGSVTESAAIVWRNGVVEGAGTNVNIPFDAYVVDGGDTLHVYPGFINGFGTWGSPKPPRDLERLDEPGNPPYDRAGVQPERELSKIMTDDKNLNEALKKGFTTGALVPIGFMLPGQVEIFYLSSNEEKTGLLKDNAGIAGSFREAPGGWGAGAYPSTLMGVMAKFRQVMFDAAALQEHIKYYAQNAEMPAPERNDVLEAMFPLLNKEVPLFFEADSKEDIERMFRLQDQFGFNVVLVSGLEAYAKANELKQRNIPVLASIDFPDAPDWYKKEKGTDKDKDKDDEKERKEEVSGDEKSEEITDEEKAYREKQLQAWKDEVSNIRKLLDANVNLGFAMAGLELKDLDKKIKILLDEGGLSEEELVRLMTVNTASILGIQNILGTVEKGRNASFSVFDKAFTDKNAKVIYNISNGGIHEF